MLLTDTAVMFRDLANKVSGQRRQILLVCSYSEKRRKYCCLSCTNNSRGLAKSESCNAGAAINAFCRSHKAVWHSEIHTNCLFLSLLHKEASLKIRSLKSTTCRTQPLLESVKILGHCEVLKKQTITQSRCISFSFLHMRLNFFSTSISPMTS